MTASVSDLIAALPLKEQEPSLLVANIEAAARRARHDLVVVSDAIRLASYLHRDQFRAARGSMPRTPYIEHPLRNTLRLYTGYGVTDQEMIVGEILHDTVEDCALEMAQLAGVAVTDDAQAREAAFGLVASRFGSGVAYIVRAMSNPLSDESDPERKRAQYAAHVEEAIRDPRVCVVKLSDFADNAAGLHHQEGAVPGKVLKLATKYLPLVPLFEARLDDPAVLALVTPDGSAEMRGHVATAKRELTRIVGDGSTPLPLVE